jgi:hypothetical protein
MSHDNYNILLGYQVRRLIFQSSLFKKEFNIIKCHTRVTCCNYSKIVNILTYGHIIRHMCVCQIDKNVI